MLSMLSEGPGGCLWGAMAIRVAILLCRRTTMLRYFPSCISQNGVSDVLALRPNGNGLPCFSELIHASLN